MAPVLGPGRGPSAGFSLVEMLVVLVMIGLLVGLAAPNLLRAYERYEARTAWTDLEQQISQLRLQAYLARQDLMLVTPGMKVPPGVESVVLNVPDGWSVEMEEGIRYRQSGVCDGGLIKVDDGRISNPIALSPPRCWPIETAP